MKQRTLLFIDADTADTRALVLHFEGRYQILCVPQGQSALQLVDHIPAEAVFVGRHVQDMTGIEALCLLHANYPALPLVFTAAEPVEALIIEAVRTGAVDFLHKPFSPLEVSACLQRLASRFPQMRVQSASADRGPAVPEAHHEAPARSRFSLRNFFQAQFVPFFATRARHTNGVSMPAHTGPAREKVPNPDFSGRDARNDAQPADAQTTSAGMRVHCLSEFKIEWNGELIHRNLKRKERAIFLYLVMQRSKHVHREMLMNALWPHASPDSARNCLNVSLHRIRKQIRTGGSEIESILFRDEQYFLNPELDIWVDAEAFKQHWQTGRRLEREQKLPPAMHAYEAAVSLYRQDFMQGDVYESWPEAERENLREIYLFILDRLSQHAWRQGELETAMVLSKKMLGKDRCREDVHQRLMRCYYQMGNRDKALRQFQRCRQALLEELEVEVSNTTVELSEAIKAEIQPLPA